MSNYYQDNGYYVFRMIATQIAMTVFGLILSLATAQQDTLFVAASAAAIVMYLWLLYSLCWEVGIKDKVRLDGGRIAYRPFRMLPAALTANAVNILLCLLAVVGLLFVDDPAQGLPTWAAGLYSVCRMIFVFIHSMYSGVVETLLPNSAHPLWNLILYLVSVVPALVFTTFGYWMGLHNRSIGSLFGMKPKFDRR